MDTNQQQILDQCLHRAAGLKTVLEKEFIALKEQDLSLFEELQSQKLEIFAFLSQADFLEPIASYSDDQSVDNQLDEWDQVIDIIAQCKVLHRRNEILINSKLESIRNALHSIQMPDPLNSVEVYDRLGKLRPGRSGKPLSEV